MSEVFRTPDDRFDALPGFPYEPCYSEPAEEFAGLRMHHVEAGSGAPILLLHGEPTWSYLYRKMIPRLSEVGRVIAPDLFGFGRSDKPTDIGWYSYDRHVRSIRLLIESLGLTGITLVVQDWGGPIGLRIAVEDPGLFEDLVILNTGVFRPGPGWPTPGFLAWRQYAEQNPDLPIGELVQGGTATPLDQAVVAAYDAPFPTPASKAGAAAFPLLVPMTEDDPGAQSMVATGDGLRSLSKPALVAFSDQDPIFSQRSGERLADRLVDARFEPVGGASHFLQEDAGERLAGLIAGFILEPRG